MLRKYIKYLVIGAVVAIITIASIYSLTPTKRYAVFAGYNPDGTIHPYVITYLKGLNEVTDGIVYIADSSLKPEEEKKLQQLTIHYENIRHEEYDFGSYKRGFNWLKRNGYLEKANELIFANDSCYAPMTSFKPMFQKMAKRKELDFWGNTQNSKFSQHLQSYFLVFRKSVINSKIFANFINSIHHQQYPAQYIAEYEIKLTPHLENLGYKWDSYQPYTAPASVSTPDLNSYPLTLITKRSNQFLKRRTFTSNLLLEEDTDMLLRYLKKNMPQRYQDIVQEIPEYFIPNDLKEK